LADNVSRGTIKVKLYMGSFSIKGNMLDVVSKNIFPAEIFIKNGIIRKIDIIKKTSNFILPGFIDSHIHIESSMVSPEEFSKEAVKHGTIAVVSDPHEIANVMGIEGIKFMINSGKKAYLKFYFGAPSCVPATDIETSGSRLDSKEIEELLKRKDIFFLSEMMNYPGVVYRDKNVIKKIQTAKKYNKPIDGHAPGLSGNELKKYIHSGISTDHETLNFKESIEKINKGMIIQIREGSATKSFDDLSPLIEKYSEKIMLCSDDIHPDDLIKGHINLLVKRAIKSKYNIFKIFEVATLNPIKHYKLNVGYLQKNQPADFVVVDNLFNLKILSTFINGNEVYNCNKMTNANNTIKTKSLNNFKCKTLSKQYLKVEYKSNKKIKIIDIIDKSLYTKELIDTPLKSGNEILIDLKRDYLKIVVLNRYKLSKPSVGFVHNFGIRYGAVASSIAHDSHNIVAVGTNAIDLANAINEIIKSKGGIAFVNGKEKKVMKLPIAGLMSDSSVSDTAEQYKNIQNEIHKAGSKLTSPLMTLSFLSLLVIPELKLSDKGLFDGRKFKLTSLFVD
jgi:adenine deaminase